jgi:hypothetical protein
MRGRKPAPSGIFAIGDPRKRIADLAEQNQGSSRSAIRASGLPILRKELRSRLVAPTEVAFLAQSFDAAVQRLPAVRQVALAASEAIAAVHVHAVVQASPQSRERALLVLQLLEQGIEVRA